MIPDTSPTPEDPRPVRYRRAAAARSVAEAHRQSLDVTDEHSMHTAPAVERGTGQPARLQQPGTGETIYVSYPICQQMRSDSLTAPRATCLCIGRTATTCSGWPKLQDWRFDQARLGLCSPTRLWPGRAIKACECGVEMVEHHSWSRRRPRRIRLCREWLARTSPERVCPGRRQDSARTAQTSLRRRPRQPASRQFDRQQMISWRLAASPCTTAIWINDSRAQSNGADRDLRHRPAARTSAVETHTWA